MRKAATVLVLGDPGPVRDELLLRPEIDVIWSASFRDALEFLRVYSVEGCVVAPEFERLDGYEPFRRGLGDVPCLVRKPFSTADENLARHDSDSVESVLSFLARHTGLVFARYPRAEVQVPVSVEVHGEKFALETWNLSVSGVGIRGFPMVEPGARVELCLDLAERPIYLLARVVRVLERDGERRAGLSFTDLEEGPRATLARSVQDSLSVQDSGGRLFGELEIPLPRPRALVGAETVEMSPVTRREMDTAVRPEAFSEMRSIAETQGISGNLIPEWFEHLADDLSELERLAALGGDAPAWAHRVLRLRISLARARASKGGEIPPSLVDEAYRTFAGLTEETSNAPLRLQQQVSTIRASLLRDVLGVVG